jgi:hypothetical protein
MMSVLAKATVRDKVEKLVPTGPLPPAKVAELLTGRSS